MTASVEQTIVVTLMLSRDETIWLRAVMQNPLHHDESRLDKKMRETLFCALPELSGNSYAPKSDDI